VDHEALAVLTDGIFSKALQVRRMLRRRATEALALPVAEVVLLARRLEPAVTGAQLEAASAGLAKQRWHKPVVELDCATGYAKWAAEYDAEANPLVAAEEPVVLELLGDVASRDVLDAGCGTGRYALRLAQAGARVRGVDTSEEMLAVARGKQAESGVEVDFRLGDIGRLPHADACFDAAVCALTLSHVADLGGAIGELARVLRPGGRLVVSEFHPFCLLIGWRTSFRSAEATYWVENHPHSIQDYVSALLGSGLLLTDLREEVIDDRLTGVLSPEDVERFRGWPLALIIRAQRTEDAR